MTRKHTALSLPMPRAEMVYLETLEYEGEVFWFLKSSRTVAKSESWIYYFPFMCVPAPEVHDSHSHGDKNDWNEAS